MKRAFLAALIALVVSGPALGADGNSLHEWCQGTATDDYKRGLQYGACGAYIFGVIESSKGIKKGVGKIVFCPHKGVLAQQVRDIVKKWLEDNPEYRHLNAAHLVAAALANAFPCKKP
jgi:hypothetical protein